MQIVRHLDTFPAASRGGAVVVGNFDGVHRGHQALIGRCREVAAALDRPAVALTFEPHPRQVFSPEAPPFRLTPFRVKAQLLAAYGIEVTAALRFDRALYSKPAEAFVADVLVDGLGARHVVVGYDFVFGFKRGGNTELLVELGRRHGFEVTVLEPVTHGDDVCSSTIIRVDLETGRTRRAADLLGHWWEVQGRVRGGDRRGRQLGFPTANLHLAKTALRPARGVYAVHFGLQNGSGTDWYPGVANLGTRPTFDGTGIVLEAHVFDFSDDIYGRHARVAFVEHLRPERRFNGIEEIRAQIAADCAQARELLSRPEYAIDRFGAAPTMRLGRG
ncbi:MAG TPA: bifunctional riboflavin kinase/FAD synthetase [Alphaproteobacteria bacterium]|jgi:riboflavin kinase/FMN adenylyltransferase|nr:bifunctional riboflavin kinase/FAD synthetase [Alphaproteobacteria bacterium]